MLRPSYVLGGRAMEVVFDERQLANYMTRILEGGAGLPILLDRFLQGAKEVDVDAVFDGTTFCFLCFGDFLFRRVSRK